MTEIDLKDRRSYVHWTPVTIRYADTDILRHVNNVAQAAYFEAARTAFVYDVIRLAGVDQSNEFVLARLTIDFHAELHYPGMVEVGSRLFKLGNKSLTTGYGIFQGDKCFATSQAVNVFYDLKTRNCIHFVGEIARIVGLQVAYPENMLRRPKKWLNHITALNPRLGAKPVK